MGLFHINNQKGATVLMGLLLMAGLVTVGVSVSNVVISELEQAKNLDNSIVSFYASESGAEKALYNLRKENIYPASGECDVTIGDVDCNIERISEKDDLYITKILKDDFKEINLYDIDAPLNDLNIRYLNIQGNGTVGTGAEILEVSWVGWDATGHWTANTTKRIYTHSNIDPQINPGGISIDLYNTGITAFNPVAFKVRLKAVNSDVNNLVLSASDSFGNPTEIPSEITMRIVGEYLGSKRALQISVPPNAPLAGIFDYVLFSECSIVKGEDPTCE